MDGRNPAPLWMVETLLYDIISWDVYHLPTGVGFLPSTVFISTYIILIDVWNITVFAMMSCSLPLD